MTQHPSPTPLRALDYESIDGCRLLPDLHAVSYLDGSEAEVMRCVDQAHDLSSLSDELHQAGRSWGARYHLSKARANVLRPLRITRDMTVLDIGGGCGAVARYLGECSRTVDVIEPVLERARIARMRTRDLSNVEIFVANRGQVPREPVYDVAVVVGVLEYIAGGNSDMAEYVAFLHGVSAALRPGGHLVCTIENRLGVKYLAGAPEDHTGRPFDGLEDYPEGGGARTFARGELARLFEAAGLQADFYHAFPDYKMARLIFSDALLEDEQGRSLACRVPSFPSPDWLVTRLHLADERRLWRSVVEQGLGMYFANSFVVVASKSSSPRLWPGDLRAAFYSTDRRACFSTETMVVKKGEDGYTFHRSLLTGKGRRVDSPPLVLDVKDSRYIPGAELSDVLAKSDKRDMARLLDTWGDLLDAAEAESNDRPGANPDLVPTNLLLKDGALLSIDAEWWHQEYSRQDVLERGVLWLATRLAEISPPSRWTAKCVRDLAVGLGTFLGLDPNGNWISPAISREAELQAHVHTCSPGDPGWEAAKMDHLTRLEELLDRQLADMPLGEREDRRRDRLEQRQAEAGAAIEEKNTHIANFQQMTAEKDELIVGFQALLRGRDELLAQRDADILQLRNELAGIRGSVPYRLLGPYWALTRVLFRPGSLRRAPYKALHRFAGRLFRWRAR